MPYVSSIRINRAIDAAEKSEKKFCDWFTVDEMKKSLAADKLLQDWDGKQKFPMWDKTVENMLKKGAITAIANHVSGK